MDQKDNLLGVVQTLWKWRRPIIFVSLAAAIGTAVISLFLPNYYQATTTFLAASPDMAKPELLFGSGNLYRNEYGNGNDIDRLLTIAESNELVEFLIDSFGLYEHYNISKDDPRAQFRVQEKFFSLYKVEKTKRDAIQLSVEDKERAFAPDIANVARIKIDQFAQQLIKDGQRQMIETFEREIIIKQQQQQALGDTLNTLRKNFRLYNTVAQTESLTSQQSEAEAKLVRNRTRLNVLKNTSGVPRDTIVMLTALVQGLEEEVKNLEQRMDQLNNGIAPINTLEKQYFEGNLSLSQDIERLKIWKAVYESYIPATILVEEAEVPLVKSRPKRSILVIAAGAIAFIFCAFAALLLDNYEVNWRTFSIQNNELAENGKQQQTRQTAAGKDSFDEAG